MGTFAPAEFELKTGENIVVRSAAASDAAALLAYITETIGTSEFFLIEPDELALDEIKEREWIEAHEKSPRALILIACAFDRPIGIVGLDENSPVRRRLGHFVTLHISVAEGWRDRGVGSALMAAALAWVESNPEIRKVGLSVFAGNDRARHVYQKWGFVEEGRRKDQYRIRPGVFMDEVIMSRLPEKSG